jgi:hypothetical protein
MVEEKKGKREKLEKNNNFILGVVKAYMYF